MITAAAFIEAARALGFGLYSGVPCSYLKPLINYVIDAPEVAYVGAANEGEAVAIAAGAELAGVRGVAMFQNSGLGNAVNPLASLCATFRVPVLLVTTWRGEPGGARDEPQHELMGQITPALFDLLRIPWAMFPESPDAIGPTLERAAATMSETGLPFGLILRKDGVAPHALATRVAPRPAATAPITGSAARSAARPTRAAVLAEVQRTARPTDALVATTGHTARELYGLGDRPGQLYVVGSMGCASSLALGVARCAPRRRVIALDGDGAVLMRMGALATLGYERPPNLVHVVLDNEVHGSTGGQATVSHSVDLAAVAHACGYPRVVRAQTAEEVGAVVREAAPGLTLVHVKIDPGEATGLPRPTIGPAQVARRFRAWLASSAPVDTGEAAR